MPCLKTIWLYDNQLPLSEINIGNSYSFQASLYQFNLKVSDCHYKLNGNLEFLYLNILLHQPDQHHQQEPVGQDHLLGQKV